MGERPVSHNPQENGYDRSALFEQLKESGDTAGLFAMYCDALIAPSESEYPRAAWQSDDCTIAGYRIPGPRIDMLEDAWHESHLQRARLNTAPYPEALLPNETALSQALGAILTTESLDELRAEIQKLDHWCERIYGAQCVARERDAELDDELLAVQAQMLHIILNRDHYEAKLLARSSALATSNLY